jgi:two-component sensor histidine kinase
LIEGTRAVGAGDLRHRLDTGGKDEYADLARNFNWMTKQLEATTVSKSEIEAREDELKTTNAEMLWEITQREQVEREIKKSLREKEVLLKEIHHRVKNNLATISSLLELQALQATDPALLEAFRSADNRVRSMALVHEQLYRSGDLAKVDFGDYLDQLAHKLLQAYAPNPDKVTLHMDVAAGTRLDLETAAPCGLIVQELVSNAFKHAFPGGREGELSIELAPSEPGYLMVIRDNGVGFPKGLDFRNTTSLGLQLVDTLAKQLDGSVEMWNGAGTEWRVRFQEANYESKKENTGAEVPA